jgi:hypothetical protein
LLSITCSIRQYILQLYKASSSHRTAASSYNVVVKCQNSHAVIESKLRQLKPLDFFQTFHYTNGFKKMPIEIAMAASVAALSAPLKDLYESGKHQFKDQLSKWNNSRNIKSLATI